MTPPFCDSAKYEIKERSGNRSELDGKEYSLEVLKCGHLDHNKKSPNYNNPENGMRLTVWQECAYHMIHQPRPQEIGLSNENNKRAVQANLSEMILKHGYEYSEAVKLIGEAIGQWEEWGKERPYKFKDDSYIPNNSPKVEFVGFEDKTEIARYVIPDNAPMRKGKKKYKGYIPGAF